MSPYFAALLSASCLVVGGCDRASEPAAEANRAANAADDNALTESAAPGAVPGGTTGLPCAFKESRDWSGGINAMPGTDPDRPKLGLSGKVKVEQAGYTAKLVETAGGGPLELRLDLLLAEPTGPLPKLQWHDVSFSKNRSPLYQQAVIMCGGAEFARFAIETSH